MYKCLHKQRYLLENIVQMQVHEENDREHQEHAQEADVDHHSVHHVLQQEDHVQDGVVDHHSSHQVLQQQDHVQEAVVDHHSVHHVLQQEDHVQDGVVDHHSAHQVLQQHQVCCGGCGISLSTSSSHLVQSASVSSVSVELRNLTDTYSCIIVVVSYPKPLPPHQVMQRSVT